MRTIVVFGATSAIAEACLRRWCDEPTAFVLVGRRRDELDRIAADLVVRNPCGRAEVVVGDLTGPAAIEATVTTILDHWQPDIAMVAIGWLPDPEELSATPATFIAALEVNGVWPALIAQLVFDRMRDAGHGHLVLLGSVAGDRGRRSNYVYGSAKAMLATLAQGLDHAAAGGGVRVSLIKPGPTDTPMTRRAGITGPLAPPDVVAAAIVDGVAAGRPVIYAPARWRMIMAVVRALPRVLFNRLDI